MIGEIQSVDPDTGIILVRRRDDGKILKVADLVNDDAKQREKTVNYLREIRAEDDMDLIIALGMAKEGFDWPYCEHALTATTTLSSCASGLANRFVNCACVLFALSRVARPIIWTTSVKEPL